MEPKGSLQRSQAPATYPYPRPEQSSPFPPPTSWRTILILSSHLCLGLSLRFPHQNPVHTSPPPTCATCPAHLILLNLITQIICFEECRSLSSSLCSLFQSPVTSSLLSPNILLNTLFSNTLNLCSSLNVSNHVSHPYKTRGKIIVLCILICIFFHGKLEHKTFGIAW